MRFLLSAAVALFATSALADIEKIKAEGDPGSVMDRLEAAVTGAGATVFARVNHGAGAESVGMTLPPAEVLIFGNPKLGTPAMQDDMLAGLFLPLKVLVYSDGKGQTWIAWEEPEGMFDGLDIDDDAGYIEKMNGALKNFADKAKSGE